MKFRMSSDRAIEQSLISHRLNGSNYREWRFQINAILRAQDLVEIVSGDLAQPGNDASAEDKKKWLQRDGKAMATLFASLNSDQSKLVLSSKSSKEIIDTLESIHNKKSDVHVMKLYEDYFALKMLEDETVAMYFTRVDTLAHEIEDQGEKLSDNLKMCRIISGLLPKFSNFRTVWFNIKETRTLNTLLSRLQLEEDSHSKTERERTSIEAAFNASSNFRKNKGKKSGGKINESTATCHLCTKIGHFKRNCPDLKGNGSSSRENNSKSARGAAFSATEVILNANYDDIWIGDSGATKHLTYRRDWFIELSSNGAQRGVKLANDQTLDVEGTGTIEIDVLAEGKWTKRRMEGVRYAPKATVNLFSLGTLTSKGFDVLLTEKQCIVSDSSTNEVVAIGLKDENNLIRMCFRTTPQNGIDSCLAVKECGSLSTLQQWHRRLGHINVARIKSMVKANLVNGIDFSDEKNFFCEECQFGKTHRSSHPSSEQRALQKGECWHADLCGEMEAAGVNGEKYFLLFKDEATAFRVMYLIKSKSEVDEKVDDFLKLVENMSDVKVKRIRFDNGTEFINANVKKILSKKGIVAERIAAYTPEQNGRVERENRTVVESARTMLVASGLDKSLWSEAVQAAVHILNRTTNTRTPEKTPYEHWFGRKPQLDHLKVFGTVGYAHIPKVHRKKWDSKAVKVFLVGFEPTSKNFRLYNPEKRKVFISCDVKFNENFVKSEYVIFRDDECDGIGEKSSENVAKATDTPVTTSTSTSTPTATITTAAAAATASQSTTTTTIAATSLDSNDAETSSRRSGLRSDPKQTEFYQADFAMSAICIEPTTFNEAMSSSDSQQWMAAIHDELKSLEENQTWDIVKKPDDCNVIGCKWVFKLKTPPNEQPKYKARLVAKGYAQAAGIDYTDTFSPVVRYDSVRCVLAIAAIEDMEIVQFDVKTAFLNGDLNETIYMKIPEGIEHKSNMVCRLKRSLYGLKQASRAWNSKFVRFLNQCGLKQSKADPCVFYGRIDDNEVIVLLYVDDGLILSHRKETIDLIVKRLNDEFRITLGSGEYYVGMEIKRDRKNRTITITQASYIRKMIEKFGMAESKSVSTPSDVSTILQRSEEENTPNFPYRQACGSLIYAATVARPDIAYAVGEISKFMERPNDSHVNAVKRIFRYLNHTKHVGITYGDSGNGMKLIGYTDADYARDIDTRRSTTGYAFKIGNGIVTWRSQRQKTIALSTTEAEFMAICDGAKEAIWLRQLLKDIGYEQKEATTLMIDNLSAIRLVQNPELHHRTKHIDIRLFFVRDVYQEDTINLKHVESENQLADAFTKPLATAAFQSNVMRLGMINE